MEVDMADEAQDVSTVEETTEVPSTENETTTETVEETPAVEEAKTVPYDRFREVIESRKELEARLAQIEAKVSQPKTPEVPADPQREAVKQEFKKIADELGFVSKEELSKQKEIEEADNNLKRTMETLESKYDGKSGLPKFERTKVLQFAQENLIGNLELAYKSMNEAAIMDMRIKEALGKTKGVKSEISDGSGSSNVGTTDNDLRSAATRGDSDAMKLLIKRAL